MPINIKNFLLSKSKKSKIGDFQDLGHIDGVAISAISANLYKESRDDLVLFYFRDGANHASVYTQSKIISENIKWNLNLKVNSIKALLVNAGNANAFTGKLGFKGITQIAEELSKGLTIKMSEDDEKKSFVKSNEILFGSTGTIGETFPGRDYNPLGVANSSAKRINKSAIWSSNKMRISEGWSEFGFCSLAPVCDHVRIF